MGKESFLDFGQLTIIVGDSFAWVAEKVGYVMDSLDDHFGGL